MWGSANRIESMIPTYSITQKIPLACISKASIFSVPRYERKTIREIGLHRVSPACPCCESPESSLPLFFITQPTFIHHATWKCPLNNFTPCARCLIASMLFGSRRRQTSAIGECCSIQGPLTLSPPPEPNLVFVDPLP